MTKHPIMPTNSNKDQSDKKQKTSPSSSSSLSLTLEEAMGIISKLEEENKKLTLKLGITAKLEEENKTLTLKLGELSKKVNKDVDALTETERNETDDNNPFAYLNNSTEPWAVKYRELRAYKSKHGDCKVPKSFSGGLGSWVDNQRTAYRNFRAGKKTAMTQQRIDALDDIEFFWGSKFPAPYKWEDGLSELEKYSKVMGHANIPIDESNQTPVAKWIRRVRKEWTLLLKGKESTLDIEKIRTLKEIGFNRRV